MPSQLHTILKPEVQRVFDHFSACFNIRILFFDAEGRMLSVGENRPDSRYCQLIRRHLYGQETCFALDSAKRAEAAEEHCLICYQCHAGLMEAIMPIYFHRRLLGTVFIGQFRTSHTLPPEVEADWRALARDENLVAAFRELPYVPQERIDHILGLFVILVDYIVSQHMVSLGGNDILAYLLAYMETHPSDDCSLTEAARMVGKSPSTVSHLFTAQLGKSFKQSWVDIKLTQAEGYMRSHPDGTVADAAMSAGYSDPLYFSRLYRRHRGFPPSQYLRQCRSTE